MKIGSYRTEVFLGEKPAQTLLLGMKITYLVSCTYDRIGNFCANQILIFNNTLFHTVAG